MGKFRDLISGVSSIFGADSATSKKSFSLTPATAQYFEHNNNTVWSKVTQENTAYYLQNCPALAYVINRKAKAFTNGKVEILNPNNDNEKKGEYGREWKKLFKNPNPLQTGRQFNIQLYTYLEAYNWCFVLPIQPAGFKDFSRISQLWVIPPSNLVITLNDVYLNATSFEDQIKEVKFVYNGTTTILNKEELFLFKGTGLSIDNLVFPDSKLLPLKYPANNIIKNYEARGTIAEKKGAIGILSNTAKDNISVIPIDEDDKHALQADYKRYGFSKDQWQLIITNASLQYQSMTMPIRDMMLLEMERADVITICDALGYPYELLGNEKGTTFTNLKEAKLTLYQDTIIPDAENIADQMNTLIRSELNKVSLNYDYTWLPVFQEDEKLKAEVRKAQGEAVIQEFNNNIITWNEMRKGLFLDTVVGMDQYKYQLKEMYNNGDNIQPTNGK